MEFIQLNSLTIPFIQITVSCRVVLIVTFCRGNFICSTHRVHSGGGGPTDQGVARGHQVTIAILAEPIHWHPVPVVSNFEAGIWIISSSSSSSICTVDISMVVVGASSSTVA